MLTNENGVNNLKIIGRGQDITFLVASNCLCIELASPTRHVNVEKIYNNIIMPACTVEFSSLSARNSVVAYLSMISVYARALHRYTTSSVTFCTHFNWILRRMKQIITKQSSDTAPLILWSLANSCVWMTTKFSTLQFHWPYRKCDTR